MHEVIFGRENVLVWMVKVTENCSIISSHKKKITKMIKSRIKSYLSSYFSKYINLSINRVVAIRKLVVLTNFVVYLQWKP